MSGPGFETITEVPGDRASSEQLSMIHTRYRLAADHCAGKDVLEAACGPGRGLRFLARAARSLVGGDITPALVARARAAVPASVKVLEMDAEKMPFPDASFDVVILFEALYYLRDARAFVAESRRVLRRGGVVLICTANREWTEFNPSPFSTTYHSARELRQILEDGGFSAEIKAGFPAARDTVLRRAVAGVRRAAVVFNLVPKTMKGKALLKRLFYGKLTELGLDIDAAAPLGTLVAAGHGPVADHKVLYAIGRRRD